MNRFFLICCLGLIALRAHAVDGNQVKYLGGTLQGMPAGAIGQVDTTAESALILQYSSGKVSIPYASIESFQPSTEVGRHLGVLPAIVVALLKARQRRHFLRISYRDQSGDHVAQVVVLEVPKELSKVLQAVLETRARLHSEVPARTRPCAAS